MSCVKAREFLERSALTVDEVADAGKHKVDRDAALELAKRATKIVVAKGRKSVVFDMTKAPPDDDSLAAHILGPTGNLRAPTLRQGTTLYVGFQEEAYQELR